MTSAFPLLAEPSAGTEASSAAAQQQQPPPPPRKRRRRTAAGGASEDCFACRKRSVACDRKRPYCTQCIEVGKECSGYKTTLTWGVGVASRGKLRGLSCPIANKNVDGSDASPQEMEARRRKSSVSKAKKASISGPVDNITTPASSHGYASTSGQAQVQPYMSSTSATPVVPQAQVSWQIPDYLEHTRSRQNDGLTNDHIRHPSLQRIQTAFAQHDGVQRPESGGSDVSYAETEYFSPMERPLTPSSIAFSEHMSTAASPFGLQSASVTSAPYLDSLGSGMVSTSSGVSYMDGSTMHNTLSESSPLDSMMYGSGEMEYDPFNIYSQQLQDEEFQEENKDMALVDTRFSSPFFQLSPRIQSLLDYYDKNVCPFLVAFDGVENPYRNHILQLAAGNEGLQSAIAALALNNMRMRRKRPRQVGFVEEIQDAYDDRMDGNANDATPEESLYKQRSIDELNMQLTNARAAQDDSVLATLLILCLFHVCDSGFSKFKTQLAGMQKLLSLRNPNVQSDFTGWVQMFFTWFDVMTSTVNDREMQIKSESVDMLNFSANLGALEQFSGCDGRLFKLIARLGRLNLLAQGRPVRSNSGVQRSPRPSAVRRFTTASKRRRKPTSKILANRSLSALDYENIDGNGWGSPILSSDDDAEGSADEKFTAPDGRREFWSEWHDIRVRLQAWEMDPATASPPSLDASSQLSSIYTGQKDMIHINETFRYSALLYTERLGNPLLPSSHPQFQNLVRQALVHITALAVDSCVNKFLLWPLFITGTECVDEVHRNIIRTRCIEVQKESGFYNNISGLEVLEKVWREVGSNVRGREGEEVNKRRRDSEAATHGGHGQAFRWRKAMDRVDGEYIII